VNHYSGGRDQRLADPQGHGQVDREDQVIQRDPEPRGARVGGFPPGSRAGPDDTADRDPAHHQPAHEVGQGDPEVEAAVRVVEDVPEEPPVAADRQRVDDHVEEHHQDAGHRDHPGAAGAGRRPPRPEGPARQAEGGVGQEGKRERREEGHVAEEQLRPPRRAGVVVEAERNADPRGDELSDQGHRPAPEQEPHRPGASEVPHPRDQEDGQEPEDVGAERQGPDELEREVDGRHALTLRNLAVFFKNGAGIRRPLW